MTTILALEDDSEAFRMLGQDNHEAYHLCVKAEGHCLAELFPRLRRELLRRKVTTSWDEILNAVAVEGRHWDKEVRRPALA